MKENVFIAAGETSGDIHASSLIKNLKSLNPDLEFSGVGGERMEKLGVDLIERMDRHSVVGVWEAVIKILDIRRIYKKIMASVDKKRPSVAILIDYPGFNLVLARGLKKRGIKVIYYITPQIWAWGGFRIHLIKRYVDKAVVILKFEEELFRKRGIDSVFVGHPLLDQESQKPHPDKKALGLAEGKFTIALLPGSREAEVRKHLPIMLKTADAVSKKKSVQFILLKSSGVPEALYVDIMKGAKLRVSAVKDDTYGCLFNSDFVFTSSGTATLESAIMERPMLIIYRTSFFTALLFKFFARTRFIGLVNIIAKKNVAPEILQYDAKPGRLASEILSIILSPDKLKEQLGGLREVNSMLGTRGASLRTARIIEGFIKGQR